MRPCIFSLVIVLVTALGLACKGPTPPTASQAPPPPPAAPSSSTAATSSQAPLTSTETAVAPEVNPPGDIPDTQAFVKYSNAAGGYQVEVPAGWARTAAGRGVK